MGKLDGKVCVITGGAKGIGRATARAFVEEGARVAVIDRSVADLSALSIATAGDNRILGVEADVSDAASVEAAFARVRESLGLVDVLVNNAGIMSYATIAEMPISMWDEMMAINLRSVFLCSRIAVADMKTKGWGRIINVSSQLAHRGEVELAHYAASKAAILGFTRGFAREVIGLGINVNAICPGPIDTDLTLTNSDEWRARLIGTIPIHRYGAVEEIVPTMVFLASEGATFYVGASMNPNGGDVML